MSPDVKLEFELDKEREAGEEEGIYARANYRETEGGRVSFEPRSKSRRSQPEVGDHGAEVLPLEKGVRRNNAAKSATKKVMLPAFFTEKSPTKNFRIAKAYRQQMVGALEGREVLSLMAACTTKNLSFRQFHLFF